MVESDFKLPIEYLDNSVVHPLSDVVASDLELVSASSSKSMYDILLNPKHEFAKDMIHKWKRSFSSDADFLKQTQEVISNTDLEEESSTTIDCESVMKVWKDVYETPSFYDRYSYIDIENVRFINKNSTFMGIWTAVILLSPALSIFLPFILIIAPFVLLKIQGFPITLSGYFAVLKDIAKKHALGKIFTSLDSFSANNLLYILFTVAMYGMQMYQNVKLCMRFYNNISEINKNLLNLQKFVNCSINNFEHYLQRNRGLTKYAGFCQDVSLHHSYLVNLKEELQNVKPFTFNVSKCFEVGYLLRCYYCLYSVPEFKKAIAYAISFEGYRSNMESLASQIKTGTIHFGTISDDPKNKTVFKNQVYPVHDHNTVENTVQLNKNLIITGPNASGKTTQLKTTAINIILTQQFGLGFYSHSELFPYTHIHSYLNIPDTSGRDSLFQAEARRCKEILDIIDSDTAETSRHFCVFDELFSGTNAEEATEASFGFLKHLQKYQNVDFILTTHFVKLCQKVNKSKNMRISNYKMETIMEGTTIHFYYKLVKGISKIKAAKLILIQMGFPEDIIKSM
jgi:hypothetical protein